jgi:chaperonin GroES
MNKITPLNGYIVLKPIDSEEETFGNIIIPDLGKERPEMGTVVATSSVYNFHTDKLVMSTLEEGEVVLIPKLGSQRIVFEGEDYYICKETDILGVIE